MGKKSGIYPHTWMSGPDKVNHKLYADCQRARAQAWFRGEEWTITEQEYINLWRQDDRYLQKGRERHCLCLTKIDPDLGWHTDNVQFISRLEHLRNIGKNKSYFSHAKRGRKTKDKQC